MGIGIVPCEYQAQVNISVDWMQLVAAQCYIIAVLLIPIAYTHQVTCVEALGSGVH